METLESRQEWTNIRLLGTDALEYRYTADKHPYHSLAINGEAIKCTEARIHIKSPFAPPEIRVKDLAVRYGVRMRDASVQELVEEIKSRPDVKTVFTPGPGVMQITIDVSRAEKPD